jgi:hypothetical protein
MPCEREVNFTVLLDRLCHILQQRNLRGYGNTNTEGSSTIGFSAVYSIMVLVIQSILHAIKL